jgi:maleylacetate reductase
VSAPRVVFGAGSSARVGDEVRRLGAARAIVLSTAGQRAMAERVARALGPLSAGTFAGAVMHTPVEVTEEALASVTALRADCLVSVGGGSTTGLAKALAARTGLPQVVLPTTYAGSEVTPVLGETADGRKTTRRDPRLQPDTVVYDVELTLSLPWDVTVTSAVNAMAHAVEGLYSPDRTPESDRLALEALTALGTGLRRLQRDPDSVPARSDLLTGAWRAGQCLATLGMGLHHQLCHILGGSFALPHAPTHTVVLPYVMEFNQPAVPDVLAMVAEALQVGSAASGLQGLVTGWGGPTRLSQLDFRPADVARAADLALERPYPNPRPVTRASVAELLTRATDGPDAGAAA